MNKSYLGIYIHSAISDNSVNGNFHDSNIRPFDPPICDYDTPKKLSDILKTYNFEYIISSPLRSCAFTSAIIADNINISSIYTDYKLLDSMDIIRNELENTKINETNAMSWLPLSDENMIRETSMFTKNKNLDIENKNSCKPYYDEYIDEMNTRYSSVLTESFYSEKNTLLISHLSIVNEINNLLNTTIYEISNNSFIIIDNDKNIVYSHNINFVN